MSDAGCVWLTLPLGPIVSQEMEEFDEADLDEFEDLEEPVRCWSGTGVGSGRLMRTGSSNTVLLQHMQGLGYGNALPIC